MAEFHIPLAQCCHKPPDIVMENGILMFQCSVCSRSVEICKEKKVKRYTRNNLIAPARAVESAVVEWNTKEEANGR